MTILTYCKHCGEFVEASSHYCWNCGHEAHKPVSECDCPRCHYFKEFKESAAHMSAKDDAA